MNRQNDNAPQRVFGYVRVSTEDQAEKGQSLSVQQRQLEGWAMQRGWELAEVIVETRKSLFQPADVLIDATV